MKVQVTALKAPWPEGTKIGDRVDMTPHTDGGVQPWALGKCTIVADATDAEVEAAQKAADEKAAADQAAADAELQKVADAAAAKKAADEKAAANKQQAQGKRN